MIPHTDRVTLSELEFFAYHGVLAEERKIGNRYRVDVHLFLNLQKAGETDALEHTIDYGEAYRIVAEQMKKTSQLLEHIALQIIQNLLAKFEKLQACEVIVHKFNPPIGGVAASSQVCMRRERNEA
ncbi:MAG: dihydroneopterin aldolase [Bernardetiaceae bacterium]|nr:dihydroneopterin aldolase [Bernardetiaceae bacterium]